MQYCFMVKLIIRIIGLHILIFGGEKTKSWTLRKSFGWVDVLAQGYKDMILNDKLMFNPILLSLIMSYYYWEKKEMWIKINSISPSLPEASLSLRKINVLLACNFFSFYVHFYFLVYPKLYRL